MEKENHPAIPESPPLGRGRGEAALSRASHLSPRTIQHLLDTLAEEVAQTLARGESYTIPGVGTLIVTNRKSRTFHNVRVPGTMIQCPEHSVVRFHPARELIDNLNAQNPARIFKRPHKPKKE